jgi:uncharacterized protein (TIGR01777 family)
MKIFITGGLGFVGSHLSTFLLDRGHHVIAVGRPLQQDLIQHENYQYLSADTTQPGQWQDDLFRVDAIVNLAGQSIFKRWSAKYKRQIYDSRILTTRNVVSALPEGKSITLCSASGAGYYGSRADDELREDEPPGNDFLANISIDWENEAFQAADKGIRVLTMRFGVVFGRSGGALSKMIPQFKACAGGPIGNGRQWFPWMHINDLMAAIDFVLEHQEISGPINFGAPNPVRNRDLATALGKVLHRPAFLPAPALMMRLALGEFSQVLLASQRIIPEKLLQHGFEFQYPEIEGALKAIVH